MQVCVLSVSVLSASEAGAAPATLQPVHALLQPRTRAVQELLLSAKKISLE